VTQFIDNIEDDLLAWGSRVRPWFRGESGGGPSLRPKIADFGHNVENHLLQSFRRRAGGLVNVPDRTYNDQWLFLAQHYGVKTRLLDWTEGALIALYFAIGRMNPNPRVYMLNPRRLNHYVGAQTFELNYPMSWGNAYVDLYMTLAWNNRRLSVKQYAWSQENQVSLSLPIAFPAVYQDQRMIAQRSCFTMHGIDLRAISEILRDNGIAIPECLFEYRMDMRYMRRMLRQLNILGVSASSVFPDLDHLADDLRFDVRDPMP